jgi:hypothetical protein
MIEACSDREVTVRPPRFGTRYQAFVDAASGAGADAFAVGIMHKDKDEIVLDLVHEVRPPFSPASAISTTLVNLWRQAPARRLVVLRRHRGRCLPR